MVTIYDYTKFRPEGEVQRALSFACERLGITDVTVVASINEKLLDKLSAKGDTEYEAVLFKTKVPHIYNLYFRPNLSASFFVEIICHEAVHLSQQEKGRLSLNLTNGECRWDGKVYLADYPYMARPWEKEAFKEQGQLIKSYRKAKKKGLL